MTWNPSLIDAPVLVEGDPAYLVNVSRSALPAEAVAFEVTPDPATPTRVFAGDELGEDGRLKLTAFLRFASEEEAIAALPDFWTEPQPEAEETAPV